MNFSSHDKKKVVWPFSIDDVIGPVTSQLRFTDLQQSKFTLYKLDDF